MEISTQHLDQLIALFRQEYGEEISRDEALKRGLGIVQLVQLSLKNENENGQETI